MKIIIGLGNPGKKYANTRHNVGFMIVDKLREAWDFSAFELNKKFNSEILEGNIDGKKIMLVKPQTFMNLSGEAARKILDFYKLTPADIIVIHDDLDIDLGKFKISDDSCAAGHNGVQDIIDKLSTQKFKRVRIGIEGEEKNKSRTVPSEDFVLQKFEDVELGKIEKVLEEILEELRNSL
ncbi:MAG: aminoacyl-tRNA hydrolase [Candidatus Moranbacteria bacterium]|nr:aminoacyl-tRNA hydrolase [Candidatus Moranbacteria bacterium]